MDQTSMESDFGKSVIVPVFDMTSRTSSVPVIPETTDGFPAPKSSEWPLEMNSDMKVSGGIPHDEQYSKASPRLLIASSRYISS